MKRTKGYFAGALALLAVLVLAGVVHLAFVFPKTISVWADEGRALSAAEQALANLSSFCVSFGLLLIPALLLTVVGCMVWAVLAGRSNKQKSANQPVEGTR